MYDKLVRFINDSIEQKIFTGASFAIRKGENLTMHSMGTLGETDCAVNDSTLFDMASCTKIFVSLAFMRLMEEGKIALTDPVERYLPDWSGYPNGKITMFQLLTHTSTFPAHVPLYEISKDRTEAIEVLRQLLPRKTEGVEYSCLGYITLGLVLERAAESSLEEVIAHYVTRPLGMKNTVYCPQKYHYDNVMPTEYCSWRRRLLVGEVHDENAAHMGGISGNAGLFSCITDMCRLADAMLINDTQSKTKLLYKNTISVMTKNYTEGLQEHRGLGWCVKNTPDMTAGEYFSAQSYGHTGYTGTSIWIDPVRNAYAILLTNRVYYSRDISGIRHVRQVYHNLAMAGDDN